MITKASSGREVSTLRRSGGHAGKSPVPVQKRSFCVRSVRAQSLPSIRKETACGLEPTDCHPPSCPEDRGWDLRKEDWNLDSAIQSQPKTRRFAPGKWFFGRRLSKNVFCRSAGAGHTRPAFTLPVALRAVIEAWGRLPGSTREVILPLSEDNGAGCGFAALLLTGTLSQDRLSGAIFEPPGEGRSQVTRTGAPRGDAAPWNRVALALGPLCLVGTLVATLPAKERDHLEAEIMAKEAGHATAAMERAGTDARRSPPPTPGPYAATGVERLVMPGLARNASAFGCDGPALRPRGLSSVAGRQLHAARITSSSTDPRPCSSCCGPVIAE